MKTTIKPLITEKSYGQSNREVAPVYTFKVTAEHSKPEIKRLVEKQYNVSVDSVNITKNPGKVRRFKGITGTTKNRYKAIVRLAKGQKIADFDIETENNSTEE